jgi:hypothetical protein
MALTHQILKNIQLLATQMQYDRMLANRYSFIIFIVLVAPPEDSICKK